MPDLILGHDSNPGGRKYNEDRSGVLALTTPGGLRLAVAVVCDGVGGEERGERAAQLAIDTVFAFLRESEINETPRLLSYAVMMANQAVYQEALRLEAQERMAATIVVAAVQNGETLYIANAGDSRIYLGRGGVLRQLTRDHNFANVMVWTGKMSPEAAAANPDADKVMRVLGIKEQIQVDLGIYLETTDYGEANRAGRQGLRLQEGDTVLLCSDGLVKNTQTTGRPLVTPKEVVQVLQRQEGEKAANAIMSLALGHIPAGEPVDNITVAVLQMPDPARAVYQAQFLREQRAKQQSELRRRVAIAVVAAAVPLGILLLITLVVFASFFARTSSSAAATATVLAVTAEAASANTEIAQAQTDVAAAFTPTPTLTPTPTNTPVPPLEPGEIARLFLGTDEPSVVTDDKRLIASGAGTAFIAVNHRGPEGGQPDNGDIFLQPAAQVQFNAVTDSKVQLRMLGGSDLFVQSGPYPNGVEIELAGSPVVVVVRGCLAIYAAPDNTLTADCYEGECTLSTDFGVTSIGFAQSKQIKLDVAQLLPLGEPGNIPQADHHKYLALLLKTGAGRQDVPRCHVPVPPTITPSPLPTATPAPTQQATVAPYGGGIVGPGQGDSAANEREAANSRGLWRLSFGGYLLTGAAWLFSRRRSAGLRREVAGDRHIWVRVVSVLLQLAGVWLAVWFALLWFR